MEALGQHSRGPLHCEFYRVLTERRVREQWGNPPSNHHTKHCPKDSQSNSVESISPASLSLSLNVLYAPMVDAVQQTALNLTRLL